MLITSQQEDNQLQPLEARLYADDSLTRFQSVLDVQTSEECGLANRLLGDTVVANLPTQHSILPDSTLHFGNSNSSSSESPASRAHAMYYCHRCNIPRAFQKKHQLKTHQRRHDPPFICDQPQCGKKFQYRKDLSRHVKTIHHHELTIEYFPCPDSSCQRSLNQGYIGFNRLDSLHRHTRTVHHRPRSPP